MHIICSFMAILDACKLRMITLVQTQPFGPIMIRRRDEAFVIDFDQFYDEDSDLDFEELPAAAITDDEELDAESDCTTTDAGRVFLYDDESEEEQIFLDDDE